MSLREDGRCGEGTGDVRCGLERVERSGRSKLVVCVEGSRRWAEGESEVNGQPLGAAGRR